MSDRAPRTGVLQWIYDRLAMARQGEGPSLSEQRRRNLEALEEELSQSMDPRIAKGVVDTVAQITLEVAEQQHTERYMGSRSGQQQSETQTPNREYKQAA
jgi:hypothetical protein